MARSQFGPRRIRSLTRAVHLTLSVATGFLLYAHGPISDSTARNGIAFVIFPLLFLTGGIMWQQAALRRLLRGARGQKPVVGKDRAGVQ
jgi:hypothetical protein